MQNNNQQTPDINKLLEIVRTTPSELNKILKQYPELDKVYVSALKIAAYSVMINNDKQRNMQIKR